MNTISIMAIAGILIGIISLIVLVLAIVKNKSEVQPNHHEEERYDNDDEDEEETTNYYKYEDNEYENTYEDKYASVYKDEPEETYEEKYEDTYQSTFEDSKYAYETEPEEEEEIKPYVEDRTVFDFNDKTSKQEEVKQEFVRPEHRKMIDEFIPFDQYGDKDAFGAEDEEEEEINLKHFEPLKYEHREAVEKGKRKYEHEEEEETEQSVSDRLAKLTKQFDDLGR